MKKLGYCALAATLVATTTMVGSAGAAGGGFLPTIASLSALLGYHAQVHAIDSVLFDEAAKCLNETDEPLFLCLDQLIAEAEEAKQVALEVMDARLDLAVYLGHGPYDPVIDPSEFSADGGNNYWPLVVGRTLVYEKETDEGGLERTEVTTLDEPIEIGGVECMTVQDIVWLDGVLLESTRDWFARHDNGSVWYFGEIALNYDDGFISDVAGSWRHGVDRAKAGILMPACPFPGDAYRQEFLFGEAEDVARIVKLGTTVTVPAGTFHNCLETEDWTPLEPGIFERKFYAPGVGVVKTINLSSGEVNRLVEIQEP